MKQRISLLRHDCLIRDHHWCVVTGKFDIAEARKRRVKDKDCEEDDGKRLDSKAHANFVHLEVAYIIPHCLTTVVPGDPRLSDSSPTRRRMCCASWICLILASPILKMAQRSIALWMLSPWCLSATGCLKNFKHTLSQQANLTITVLILQRVLFYVIHSSLLLARWCSVLSVLLTHLLLNLSAFTVLLHIYWNSVARVII